MTAVTQQENVALKWLRKRGSQLSDIERSVLDHVVLRHVVSKDPSEVLGDQLTFGQRLADKVAKFGGSWTFIIFFGVTLLLWVLINSYALQNPFDSYPYTFLNLLLSMLAAIQAPVIMMSQNRLAAKDRQEATHDYAINLKAEIEIMALHEKVDQLRTEHIEKLLAKQQEQIVLLTDLISSIRK